MKKYTPFSETMGKMSPERRKKINSQATSIQRSMRLAELRSYSGLTQSQLASRLGVTQPSLSKMESQNNIELSSLQRYVAKLGGELEVVAHMPDGDVVLSQFLEE